MSIDAYLDSLDRLGDDLADIADRIALDYSVSVEDIFDDQTYYHYEVTDHGRVVASGVDLCHSGGPDSAKALRMLRRRHETTYALVESVDGGEGFRYFATGPLADLERLRPALERELGFPLLAVPLP